ncbi:hypothetical protein M0722_12855 [Microbacterium sp. KSW4-16]|uniref:ApeA N-terminal domain 1-containing protein n=1 Tax=Microbacterium aurugineum TaxID=2851642 RepID=UPI0020BFD275|nr:HEPN domain-containing protein [Microbacterium aurugineum]MCK8468085.1 hypothetical protein [Microbacterium aurugineum]
MNDELTLDEERSWSGQWWLPENPDDKVAGVLSYHPDDGLTLTLIGGWEYRVVEHLGNGATSIPGETLRWEMIHGRAENKLLTLLDAGVQRAQTFAFARMFDGGPDELVLHANTLLVGCLLDEPSEPAFEAAIVTAENLTTWSCQGGVTTSQTVNPETRDRTRTITADTVPPLSVQIDDLTAKLHTVNWAPAPAYQRWGTTAGIRERVTFEFAATGTRSLAEWIRLMATIEDLLSLSTLRACALIWTRVYLPATPERWPEDHPQRNRRREVEVYQQRILTPRPGEKAVDMHDFVLTLNDLPFDKLIPRWLEVDAKFSAARSMILGLRYVTGGYLESKVVTAVAAAESMSRALKPPPVMTKGELKALRKTVLAVVPEERRSWVRERLISADPTLPERLAMLATRPGEFMSKLVPNVPAWAESAASARNKLAHVGQSRHTANELHAVVEVTSAVVVMNFLFELGVPADRMEMALSEHRRLAAAARLAHEMFPATTVEPG